MFSIIILTKNSLGVVNRLVDSILSQDFDYPFEIIFMDNNSRDGTLQYLKEVKRKNSDIEIKILHVPENEFSHSATRMKAARLAKGEFLIFFTDDILPIDKHFLENLTKPVRIGKASASYGVFQIGGMTRFDPIAAYLHNGWFEGYDDFTGPINPYCWSKLTPHMRRKLSNFDNCASCIRKDVLLALEFPPVSYGEDMTFAKKLILNNHKVALAKSAKFYHWHYVKFTYMLKRMCVDQILSIREFDLYYLSGARGLLKVLLTRLIYRIIIGIFLIDSPIKEKLYWIIYNIKITTADFLGKYIGTLEPKDLRGPLVVFKKKLLRLQKDIVNEIDRRSIIRY